MLNLFKKKKQEKVSEQVSASPETGKDDSENEIVAAISIALNAYLQNIHDYENVILTIQKVVRPYSPWSSKIYGLRQYPRR